MKRLLQIFFLVSIVNSLPAQKQTVQVLPHTIVFKVKTDSLQRFKQKKISYFNNYLLKIQAKHINRKFPHHQSPKRSLNKWGFPLVDLSRIYTFSYTKTIAEQQVANDLMKMGFVEYAEPYSIPQLFYEPNDPKHTTQYALTAIHAYEGWDIEQGDSTVVVGIVDCGVDFDHEDIHEQVAYNTADPPNGVDDDNDGYIDNFRGWDFGNNDADPTYDEGTTSHGLWVTGAACARVDNNKGIAGVGFHVKFLPVKVMNSNGIINSGYEGIVYAADHGCLVINCSWGSIVPTHYGQDVVDYATYNRNALVVGAAGNNADSVPFYPASYENVLSVAGTNPHNEKWNKSSYGIYVDICAPGDNVLTTFPDNTYSGAWGTSFAAPQVSAAAALLKSHSGDSLSALQLGELLKVTADNIDTITANQPYRGLLGAGLLNMRKALSDTVLPSVQYRRIAFSKQTIYGGDTVAITGAFINFLSSATALKAVLTTTSPYVTVLDSVVYLDTLKTMETKVNDNNPFRIIIDQSVPFDEEIDLKLIFTDASFPYQGFQYIRLSVNPSYLTIHPNTIRTTVTANGKNGYNSFSPVQGVGFMVDGCSESLFYESGLMVGVSADRVADAVRGGDDFTLFEASRKDTEAVADSSYLSVFKADKTDSLNLALQITQQILAWNDTVLNHTLWYRYHIQNKSSEEFNHFYAGWFTDWDLENYNENILLVDTALSLSYCYQKTNPSVYVGVQLLTQTSAKHFYAIDNVQGGDGTIDISNGYSDEEKQYTMSHNRYESLSEGCDVAQVVSYGPLTVGAYDTVSITMAYLWANSLQDLKIIAGKNKIRYDSLYCDVVNKIEAVEKNTLRIYPNPVSDILTIEKQDGEKVLLSLFSMCGKKQFSKVVTLPYRMQMQQYPAGIYLLQISNGNMLDIKRIVKW